MVQHVSVGEPFDTHPGGRASPPRSQGIGTAWGQRHGGADGRGQRGAKGSRACCRGRTGAERHRPGNQTFSCIELLPIPIWPQLHLAPAGFHLTTQYRGWHLNFFLEGSPAATTAPSTHGGSARLFALSAVRSVGHLTATSRWTSTSANAAKRPPRSLRSILKSYRDSESADQLWSTVISQNARLWSHSRVSLAQAARDG